jgi:hypothetical protein
MSKRRGWGRGRRRGVGRWRDLVKVRETSGNDRVTVMVVSEVKRVSEGKVQTERGSEIEIEMGMKVRIEIEIETEIMTEIGTETETSVETKTETEIEIFTETKARRRVIGVVAQARAGGRTMTNSCYERQTLTLRAQSPQPVG